MLWAYIGWIATLLTSIQFIPQVIKAYQTESSKDISALTYILVTCSSITWIAHGFHVQDYPILVTNLAILFCSLGILVIKAIHQ